MESSELFSHREHQEPVPDPDRSIEPELIFSDRPMPRADAQSS